MNPITLPLAELKPALAGLGKLINRHASLPVLTHVKIERTHDGWITLTTTDLDHFVTLRLEQPVEGEPLVLLIPHEELVKVCKTCARDESLHLEPAPDNEVLIKFALAGQLGESRIASLPVEQFPQIPRIRTEAIPLPDHLRASIHEALECSSHDDTRLILQGAFLDAEKPDAHYVVGTDGRHLYSSNSFRLPMKDSVLIPAHKFLDWKEFNNDGSWQLKVSEGSKDAAPHVQIATRRWRFISRQLEGVYPRWKAVLPDTSGVQTRLDFDPGTTDQLTALIHKMPCHDSQHQTLGIRWQDGKVMLLGKASNAAAWTMVEVPSATGNGSDLTVFFNRNYLLKALRFGLTHLDLINAISPLRFSHEGRQMIVMPLREEAPETAPPSVPTDAQTLPAAPAASPTPEERKPMLHHTAPEGSTPSDNNSTPPTLDDAIAMVETLKDTLQNGLTGLKELSLKLKAIGREHRTNAKDLQQFRSTLRTLQSVKL